MADLNGDGWQDLVVFNHLDRGDHSIGANLFWGSPEGYSYARRDWIPTFGPHFGVRRDIGNVYDRKLREEYISPALECPAGKHPARLSWRARTPKGTAVKFQIRSAATREELGPQRMARAGRGDVILTTPPLPWKWRGRIGGCSTRLCS